MGKVSEEITPIQIDKEIRTCPACGYEYGYHVSFIPDEGGAVLRLVLICPQCGARFEAGGKLAFR